MLYFNGASTVTYYFDRNIRGDVIRIYNPGGGVVAKYTYDAYGNCNIASGTTSFAVADANPIRYRGYYYDSDTKLYYLNARYYNPQWRRFISPDSTEYIDPEAANGLNLYAYCGNDPVNYADPSGCLAIETLILTGLLVGLGIGAGIGYAAYTDRQDDNEVNGSVGWEPYLGGAMMGGAIGFGIAYFGPQLLALISSSLPALGTAGVTSALAVPGGVTVTVTGAQIVGGAIVAGVGIMLFASDHRPGNNKAQNKQIRDAIRRAGYDPNDPKIKDKVNKIETYIRRHKLDYGWKKLFEFVKERLG